MKSDNERNSAVSEIVGEMLMIGIVLILVSVFSASLPDYLPSERSPTVTIRMGNDSSGQIFLWHKGGDWVKADSLKVILSNASSMETFTRKSSRPLIITPDTQAFDLGGTITVNCGRPLSGGDEVVLATDRAVLFSGRVGRGS
ncbi:type IV pilin N-terminal domain-containing protein [uncultured Methanoregula sp.]|uniref:type IV pilin N-terminal domain-containing protein n=1 Tax=uncultured Methanoregula sp. TaxID=1005933 RepID=UPI002AAAF32C|nr:type IV pilin N-terminal domain-containing protein [uncultured Methanoregula sp.]